MLMRTTFKIDVGHCEGFNSLIRSESTRCRRISLPLLSFRCNMKKQLRLGCRGQVNRFSFLKPFAEKILNECMANYDEGLSICNDDDRWSEPAMPMLPTEVKVKSAICRSQPAFMSSPATKWAARQALGWHNGMKDNDFKEGGSRFCFALVADGDELRADDMLWIVGDKNYSLGVCAQCHAEATVLPAPQGRVLTCHVSLPLFIFSTAEIMLDFFGRAVADGQIWALKMYPLTWTFDNTTRKLFGIIGHELEIFRLSCKVELERPRKARRIGDGGRDEEEELVLALERELFGGGRDEASDVFEDRAFGFGECRILLCDWIEDPSTTYRQTRSMRVRSVGVVYMCSGSSLSAIDILARAHFPHARIGSRPTRRQLRGWTRSCGIWKRRWLRTLPRLTVHCDNEN